ncbi:hypothetical protein GUJ93_ZPchr0006g43650 [Zizania palustris]|uniref:Uncharacterized protein n=1 Tax=Zizania palustris TaxID=103762 RepID=A0A8J5SL33_ZIZPA|nr:hypothetical protein GUJ93_ZPchr0006g43650 [Zizania palustris]
MPGRTIERESPMAMIVFFVLFPSNSNIDMATMQSIMCHLVSMDFFYLVDYLISYHKWPRFLEGYLQPRLVYKLRVKSSCPDGVCLPRLLGHACSQEAHQAVVL